MPDCRGSANTMNFMPAKTHKQVLSVSLVLFATKLTHHSMS